MERATQRKFLRRLRFGSWWMIHLELPVGLWAAPPAREAGGMATTSEPELRLVLRVLQLCVEHGVLVTVSGPRAARFWREERLPRCELLVVGPGRAHAPCFIRRELIKSTDLAGLIAR